VEALTQCPTYFGRKNKLGGAVETLNWIKDRTVNVKAASALTPDKLEGKLLIGELYSGQRPEYTASYGDMTAKVQRTYNDYKGGNRGCELNSD